MLTLEKSAEKWPFSAVGVVRPLRDPTALASGLSGSDAVKLCTIDIGGLNATLLQLRA